MAKIQAKNKEQQEFVRSKLTDVASWVGIVNEDRVELDGWVDFGQMAEIVDYLRGDECLIKAEDFDRLLKENRKLNNEYIRLTIENANLKEKCKNLPRIATLNKRIHELKEKLKKYEEE